MVTLISTFLRHYILCFFGALVRYSLDCLTGKKKKEGKKITFKDYRNYDEKPDVEILDAIVGFIIFGIIISVFVRVTTINGW